jgi:hypothetical protein
MVRTLLPPPDPLPPLVFQVIRPHREVLQRTEQTLRMTAPWKQTTLR